MKTESNPIAETGALENTSQESAVISRREFVQTLGAGLVISVVVGPVFEGLAASRGGLGGRGQRISARVHIATDGAITVLTGKVEGGNGARTELAQAAAEELRIPAAQLKLIMGDTELVPDDGITAGSRSTPSTVPAVRRGTAAARQLLEKLASAEWNVPASEIEVAEGKARRKGSAEALGYKDLASSPDFEKNIAGVIPSDVVLTPLKEWKTLGQPVRRANGIDLITGAHKFPSDIRLPGMLYGKVLRRPSYGARLVSIDLEAAKISDKVVVVRDGDFVGVAAPTSFEARRALEKLGATAKWETSPHPSSKEVFDYLRHNPDRQVPNNRFPAELGPDVKVIRRTYHVPYVQHAPLEPRAAVAEWIEGKLTVWTGSQNPFGARGELGRAFSLEDADVRVIVPDFGSGFGGKHMPDATIEAARLAKAAGRPVSVRWTREEEFTWAYFRPAAVIDAEATLDSKKSLSSWFFVNINSGGAALDTPYRCGKKSCEFVGSHTPMRQGSYRALAATANTFARESFMDELALEAAMDPLEFRLAHLDNPRLRAVLETAAARFGWKDCVREKKPNIGYGLACSTEKGSFVATCAEIELVGASKQIKVRRICEAFECGAILNPHNLLSQVTGEIIMALGPALREEMIFANGKVENASFTKYTVPRFADVPKLEIHLLNRPDLDSVGGGETPLIAVAPAIANAVFHASGVRVRELPIRLPV